MEHIKDKVIVITGASSGIGEATAKTLAENGAKLVLAARRLERLEKLAAEINSQEGEAIAVAADVAKRSDVQALIEKAIDHFGKIDVLINNAGIMPVAPMEATRIDDWDRMIDVNVKGLLYGIGAALPHMKGRKKVTSSILPRLPATRSSRTSRSIVRPSTRSGPSPRDFAWKARRFG